MSFLHKAVFPLSTPTYEGESIGTLHHDEQTIITVLEQLTDGVIVFESSFCTYWNPLAVHMASTWGISSRELLGATETQLLHALFGLEGATQYNRSFHAHCIQEEGQTVDVEFVLLKNPGHATTVLLLKDVTETTVREHVLQDMDKHLVLGELAASLAHEIRNPLASLRGFTQMLQRPERQTSANHYLSIMITEIDRINNLIEEFLQLAKPRTQPFVQSDILLLVEDVLLLLNPQALMQAITLHFSYDVPQPLLVTCQPYKLKQALINIVKNAIEASPSGSTISISVSASGASGSRAEIRIQDAGPGMPEIVMETAGKKYYSTKESGTGLGLMISHAILSDHEGHITIESSSMTGTVMMVSLPLRPSTFQQEGS